MTKRLTQIAQSITLLYASIHKTVLPLPRVVMHLVDGFKTVGFSYVEAKEHVEWLAKNVPKFCEIVSTRDMGVHLKLLQNTSDSVKEFVKGFKA